MDNVLQFPDQAVLMRVSTAIDAYLRAGNPRWTPSHPDQVFAVTTRAVPGLLQPRSIIPGLDGCLRPLPLPSREL